MSEKIHVILPDSHAHPDFNNDRFSWFGNFLCDIKPTTVINIGDLADFPSMCMHSKALEREGGRYQADCAVAYDAQERIFAPLRKAKKKMPRFVYTLGNHDIRPDRYAVDNPTFQGKLSYKDTGCGDFPWEVYPFLDVVDIDDISYSHYFTSGIMGRPIGGTHPAWSTIKKRNKSSVAGHSHVFDLKIDRTTGRDLLGLSVGCYVDYHADYAGPANHMWARGVCVIRDIEDGVGDVEFININRLRKAYGK